MRKWIKMKNNYCKNCIFYNPLYRIILHKFFKEQHGICCNLQKLVMEKDVCDFYQPINKDIKTIFALIDNAMKDVIELEKMKFDE